jgi:hypothetical protein
LNKNLPNEEIAEEVRKIRGLTNAILADIDKEQAAKAEETVRLARQREREANDAAFQTMRTTSQPTIFEPPPEKPS